MKANKTIGKTLFAIFALLLLAFSVLPAAVADSVTSINVDAPDAANVGEEFQITVSAEDADGVLYVALYMDGEGWDTAYNVPKDTDWEFTWTVSEETAGNKHYRVQAGDVNGNKDLDGVDVMINGEVEDLFPEVTSATADVTEGDAPLQVLFEGTAEGGDAPLAYEWDFGNDDIASSQNVRYVFTTAGIYLATFTVTDADGDSDSEEITITVTEAPTPVDYLQITDVDFDDDVNPGDNVEFEVEIENTADFKLEEVVVEVSIIGIDEDNDDLEVETEEFKLNKDDEEERTLTLSIPYNVDAGDYDIVVKLSAETEDGDKVSAANWVKEDGLEVEKEKHDVAVIDAYLSSETVAPGKTTEIAVEIANIGQNDETVRIKIEAADLNVEEWTAQFELEEGETAIQYVPFKVPGGADAGKYFVNAIVYFDDGANLNSDFVTLTVGDETTATSSTGAVTLTPVVTTVATEGPGALGASGDAYTIGALIVGILILLAIIVIVGKEVLPIRKATIIESSKKRR